MGCVSFFFFFNLLRTRRGSFSSKDDKREDRTPYQLVKKLQKKIRQFEEQFEKEKNSKVSYSCCFFPKVHVEFYS